MSTGEANRKTERPEGASAVSPPPRLAALDAFRGLTVLLMLLVNNISLDTATPKHLTHAEWSGRVHTADVVFPWFLFAVGVAIPFAVASHRRKGGTWLNYFGKAIRRTASLILLGILVDSTINHAWTPGLGVLQIIGLAYFIGALLSPLPLLWRTAVSLLLLAGHSWLLLAWHVPGFGPGRVTETTNAVAFLNEIYLAPWGIKGLVSAVPTAGMVLIGSVFGELFQKRLHSVFQRAFFVLLGGCALMAVGYIGGLYLPMNKPLWTAPYILFTAGLGATVLAFLHVVVDGTKYGAKFAFPLLVPGANAITGYVAPILVKINVLQGWTVVTATGRVSVESALQTGCYFVAGRVNGGWLYTFGYIAVWWFVLYYLYRKQWFLRV